MGNAVEFIAILAQHIPHARRHQVRYYGACTPEVRKRLGLSGKPLKIAIPARTAARGRRSCDQQRSRPPGASFRCISRRTALSILTTASSTASTTNRPRLMELSPPRSARIQDLQQTSWSLSTTTPASSYAGHRIWRRTMETRRSEVLGRAIAAHRHSSALTPAAIPDPSGHLVCHSSESQHLEFSILTRRVENDYRSWLSRLCQFEGERLFK